MDLDRLQQSWDEFGRQNAMWAVLTNQEQWDLDAFLQTGELEIEEILSMVDCLSPGLKKEKALDFGCGVGRLSQALASRFSETHGVDIAPSMITQAEQINRYPEKCYYHHNPANDLKLFPDDLFDFIYSNITLQHIPPRYSAGYIGEFMRILKPGGVMVFQLPDRLIVKNPVKRLIFRLVPDPILSFYRNGKQYLIDRITHAPRMEMHGIPREDVERLIQSLGGQLLHCTLDTRPVSHPELWISYIYFVGRQVSPA